MSALKAVDKRRARRRCSSMFSTRLWGREGTWIAVIMSLGFMLIPRTQIPSSLQQHIQLNSASAIYSLCHSRFAGSSQDTMFAVRHARHPDLSLILQGPEFYRAAKV